MVPRHERGPRELDDPPELEVEMTPAVRAFVELLLNRIETLEAEVAELNTAAESVAAEFFAAAVLAAFRMPSGATAKSHRTRKPGGQPGHAKSERVISTRMQRGGDSQALGLSRAAAGWRGMTQSRAASGVGAP